MSEKKYIFKIDNSKYIEKINKAEDEPDISKFADLIGSTSSDFKITCDNCLYNKEIKLAENFRDYYGNNTGFALFNGVNITIVENEDVIDIAKDEYGTVIRKSSGYAGDSVAYFSDKNGNRLPEYGNNEWNIANIIEDFKGLYNAVSSNDIFLLENLTDTHIQDIVEYITDSQLQTLIKYLTDNQLQALGSVNKISEKPYERTNEV